MKRRKPGRPVQRPSRFAALLIQDRLSAHPEVLGELRAAMGRGESFEEAMSGETGRRILDTLLPETAGE